MLLWETKPDDFSSGYFILLSSNVSVLCLNKNRIYLGLDAHAQSGKFQRKNTSSLYLNCQLSVCPAESQVMTCAELTD